VTHYYGHLSVAVVQMESGTLRVGDTIHVVGHTSDFRQRVESMQIEHAPVSEVSAGQVAGLRVTDHAREHDVVYRAAARL
jgi:translation elongation factor EF-1alpha